MVDQEGRGKASTTACLTPSLTWMAFEGLQQRGEMVQFHLKKFSLAADGDWAEKQFLDPTWQP